MNRRILIPLIIVIVIIGIVAYAGTRRNRPIPVTVQQADIDTIVSHVTATGNIQPVTEVQISAYVIGRITELPVKEGDTVKDGQKLVQIDPTSYRAQVSQEQANLDLAQASLNNSRILYQRSQQLYKANLISQQDMQQAETQFELDNARFKQAQAALAQAQDQLDKTTILSPIGGVITKLNVELGEVVVTGTMNVPGSVIMVVADLDSMEAECSVDETDIPNVKTGQNAAITVDALPDKKFSGVVTEVGNAAINATAGTAAGNLQNTTVNYNVVVLIHDSLSLLKPDMTANVEITTAIRDSALVVPIQAIVTRPVSQVGAGQGEGARPGKSNAARSRGSGVRRPPSAQTAANEETVVFIDDNGVARIRPVSTGLTGDQTIEITKGLENGQKVITGPFAALKSLKDGDKIKIQG